MAPNDATSVTARMSELGFGPMVTGIAAVGLLFLVMTGLFGSIIATSDDPSEGLADTRAWFGWIAVTLWSIALVLAGLLAKTAGTGARVALLAVGAVLLVESAGGTILPNFFSFL